MRRLLQTTPEDLLEIFLKLKTAHFLKSYELILSGTSDAESKDS